MTVEPVLLSLCCYQLNRRCKPEAQIDEALVLEAGQDILDDFYREALDDDALKGPPEVASFIEGYLIQGDHFRGDYPIKEALDEKLLTEKQLTVLTDKHRLLRIVSHPDTTRVELIHDRLVPVVRKARDERKVKQRQDEQERLAREAQADRDKERAHSEELQRERDAARHSFRVARFTRNVAFVVGIVSVILGLLFWNVEKQKRAEAEKRAVSMIASRLAEGRQAIGANMEPWEQMMYRGLAAYRLSQKDQGLSQARAASLTALHSVMESASHLRKAVTIEGLVPTPALAYSPDGNTLAVGGEDGLVRLLNAETYHETGRLDCGQSVAEPVWSLAYNSDGTRLSAGYSANSDKPTGSGLVCVFDVLRPKILHRFDKGMTGDIYSVAYGGPPEAEFVVSGGSDKMLRIWNLNPGKAHELHHKDEVSAVAVSPDNRWVASGSKDGIVRLWNRAKLKRQPVELKGHEATVQQIAFSPTDSNQLVSAGDDGRIIVWNVKGRCREQQSKQQVARIMNLSLSRDGLIAAASADGYVRIFRQLENGTPCNNPVEKRMSSTVPNPPELPMIEDGELSGHGGLVMGTTFNPEGTRLASTGEDGSIRIWGYKTPGFSLAQLELKSNSGQDPPVQGHVATLAISPDSKSIAVGDENGNLYLWGRPEMKTDHLVLPATASWRAHDEAIRSLIFLQIGSRLAIVSGGDDGVVKRWDAVSRHAIGPDMTDQAKPIRSIAPSPDGKILAAGSSDGTIRLWDVETSNHIRRLEKPSSTQADYELYAISFTGNGNYLAVGDSYVGLRILDVAKAEYERRLQGHTDLVKSVSHGGGRWLLSAGIDGRILEWQQTALKQSTNVSLKKHDEFMFQFGFRDRTPLTAIDTSKDRGLILIGGHKGRIELWDGDEHVQIAGRFPGHQPSDIRAIALASDGKFFVTADASTVLVWPGPDEWADIVCSKLDKNMSHDQWREWVSPEINYVVQCPGLPIPSDASEHMKEKP